MKRRKQSRRWRGKKYAPVMIGMLVLLMNLADLKISNLISGSIICQASERQSENTETENNSGGTEKEKITQTEASTVSDILEELDLSRVQRMLDQMLGEESFSMKDMLDGLIKGEKVLSEDTVQEMVHSFLFSGLEKEKSLLIKILLLILLSAVLANFADVFESGQIGDICFYIVYLLLFILLMDSFSSVTRSVQQTITWMAEFMRGLAPAYFLTISIAAGSSTAAVFYEGVLILTWLIQEVILNLLFPGACLYVLISLINNLSKEEMLGKMAELLDTAVSWGLKTLLGMVVGLQVVRGLIAPVMDTLKRSALGKAAGALPGVGNAVNMVTELVLTSAVLVRNCLGVVILFAFVAAGAGPVIHYGILSLLYRFLAAIAQPVSEKRIVDSLATMGEGCALLLRILFTAEILCILDFVILMTGIGGSG
ncbi:stage III sporulation protein AE [Blautia obeum]|uniref:stage III sporulation protein AE n=1 Tax=Blautia obeum TaxID=40520 RepID=UPI002596162B|nr:stage III sporulation protein AE [uncultured Blautia sp.]